MRLTPRKKDRFWGEGKMRIDYQKWWCGGLQDRSIPQRKTYRWKGCNFYWATEVLTRGTKGSADQRIQEDRRKWWRGEKESEHYDPLRYLHYVDTIVIWWNLVPVLNAHRQRSIKLPDHRSNSLIDILTQVIGLNILKCQKVPLYNR